MGDGDGKEFVGVVEGEIVVGVRCGCNEGNEIEGGKEGRFSDWSKREPRQRTQNTVVQITQYNEMRIGRLSWLLAVTWME